MKKASMILSFVLACVLSCGLFLAKDNAKIEKASARIVEGNKSVIIVGCGEVEVEPDTIQINFGIRSREQTLQQAQTKLSETFKNVVSKIQEIDPKAEVYVNYSSSFPVAENGLLSYEFDCCIVAKSNQVDKKDALVENIASAGATSIYNTSYSLQNKIEAYKKALIQAKENADEKVKALFETSTLKGLKEESCYSCYDNGRNEKIKVCAKIKAIYDVGSSTQNSIETTSVNNTENVKKDKAETSENKTNTLSEKNEIVENSKNKTLNNSTTQVSKSDNNSTKKETSSNQTEKNSNSMELTNSQNEFVETENNQSKNNSQNEIQKTSNEESKITNTFNESSQKKQASSEIDNTLKTVLNDDKYVVKADNTIVRNDEIMTLEETKEIA